jgi:uncharacterized protein YxjI
MPGSPANWYPDPLGRHEHRYWDGSEWTEHVASRGRSSVDPPDGISPVPALDRAAKRIRRQVRRAGVRAPASEGGGSVFTEAVLVVSQRARLVNLTSEYAVYDRDGEQLGAVREVGQSTAEKAVRLLTPYEQYLTRTLQVVDMSGRVLLALTRPAKLVRSRVIVRDGSGAEVGRIVQQNTVGRVRFGLEAGGHAHGSINAENWRVARFNIRDGAGIEVARITKTRAGLGMTALTTRDSYVVQIHRPLEDPLCSLVVAAALAVDTALKPDARGFG